MIFAVPEASTAMAVNQTANGVAQNGSAVADANAAGEPDTPVEVLTALLGQALKSDDPGAVKQLVQQAHSVVAGLDPYLDSISTPPGDVSIGITPALQADSHASRRHWKQTFMRLEYNCS